MNLQIISPEKKIFEGAVKLVQLPGIDGSFEILKNHAPLVSVLKKGKVKIHNEQDQKHFFDINGGVIEVMDNKVLILAE